MIDGQNLEQRGALLVKPLHWVKIRDGIYEISACATTSIGRYEAWHFLLPTDPPEDFYGWKGPFTENWEAEDFEAAVAAAQADYLQRILGRYRPPRTSRCVSGYPPVVALPDRDASDQ